MKRSPKHELRLRALDCAGGGCDGRQLAVQVGGGSTRLIGDLRRRLRQKAVNSSALWGKTALNV